MGEMVAALPFPWRRLGVQPNCRDEGLVGLHAGDRVARAGSFVFQPARLCPDSIKNSDARQMRMTEVDTRHATKSVDEHRALSLKKARLMIRH